MLKTSAYLKRNMSNALRSKYGLCPYDGIHAIKHMRYSKMFPLLARCDLMFCRLYMYVSRVLHFLSFYVYVSVCCLCGVINDNNNNNINISISSCV